MLRRPLFALTAAVLAVVLAACAAEDTPDEVAALRAELAEREDAEQALADRVEALERDLAAVGTDTSTSSRLDDLDDRLAQLDGTLTVLDDRIDGESSARQLAQEEAEVTANDLRSGVTDLQRSVEALQGEAEELRTLYETLRDRLDRQQQD